MLMPVMIAQSAQPEPACKVIGDTTSGVVLDSCAQHGTWFDADELRRVVEFVRDGGLDRARAHERQQLEEQRRLLDVRQKIASWGAPQPPQREDASPAATGSIAEVVLRLFGTF